MTYEMIYSAINLAVMPAWALLVFLPRAKLTRTLVHSGVYPVALGLFYLGFFAAVFFFGIGSDTGGFTTAASVSAIFSHPVGVLIGWSHYLVFDLFVGAWVARDGARRGINHFALVPCILLCWIAGPIGLLLYVLLRLLTGNGFSLEETQ